MAYTKNRSNWIDSPSTATPVMAAMLNNYESTLFELSAGIGLPATRYLKGDGSDETTAFQNWIAAAKSSGEIMVGNANMTVKVSGTLDLRANGLRYIGNGMQIINTGTNLVGVYVGGLSQVITGLHHAYSAQQSSSQTNAAGIELYEGFQSYYFDWWSDLAYDGIRLAQSGWAPISTVTNVVFSCLFQNIFINGYSHRALSMQTWPSGSASSTGCVFQNVYTHNNYTGSVASSSDAAMVFTDWDESVFGQINIEWNIFPSGQSAIFLQAFRNCTINSIHFEGLTIPGTAGLFRTYGSTNLSVYGLNWVNSTLSPTSGVKSVLDAGFGAGLSVAHSMQGVRINVSGQAALVTATGSFVLCRLDSDMSTNNATITFDQVDTSSFTSASSLNWVVGDDPNSPVVEQINEITRGARSPETERLASGISTMPRGDYNTAAAGTMTSQLMRWTYFTAPETMTATQFRLVSGGTAAGATPTLVQASLWTVDASSNLTRVVVAANTTTLLAAANTVYASAFVTPASYTLVAGKRYAIGLLVVTAATAPTVPGQLAPTAAEMGLTPVLASQLAAQATTPTSATAGSVTASATRIYAAVLP
jgi:hypothetical protein